MSSLQRPRAARRLTLLTFLLAAALPGLASVPAVSLAAPLPTIAVDDVTITEGNAGTLTATFTVTQSGRG